MNKKTESKIEKLRKPISRFIVVALLAVALFTIPKGFEDGLHEFLEISGYAFLIAAGLGRIWCSLYIAGRKDKKLCIDGPYSICRNPLYFFSFIGVIGAFLALQSLLLVMVSAVLYLYYYYLVIRSEERRLSILFRYEFTEYKNLVPRFLPKLRGYFGGQPERMTSTRIIERGMREVVWFFAAIVIIDALEMAHHNGLMVYAHLPF